ncbi:S8 family serine peptidase [Catellatospora paridis]|uniref:S8 family serine peptidase n=1 Tax=Catellatospora paridis TaxID=1617086 RepID=UPI0018AFB0EC|nr:S8 family serine peptidase [Catellatospora paridis]
MSVIVGTLATAAPTALAADQISVGQWFHAQMNTGIAHKITKGEGVVVAVVDTGVDANHPDLAGSVLSGADFSSEGPGDGRTDRDGHGTAMAGLIAAHGRVGGVAPAAKILPVRSSARSLGTGGLSKGIRWAVGQSVDVISLSLGAESDDIVLQQAVEEALAADIVVVAAVGNRTHVTKVGYPATYPGVLAVSGVDQKGLHSSASVSGAPVDIAAPCDGVSSTSLDGGWGMGTGTSNSAALVAGAAALVRARFPDMPATEVIHRLTATAVDKGQPGPDGEYGYGLVDVSAALSASVPSLTPSAKSATPQAGPTSDGTTPPRSSRLMVVLVGGMVLVLAAISGRVWWLRRQQR